MLNVYLINKKYEKCLQLFNEIETINKNYTTYTIVFTACATNNNIKLEMKFIIIL